MASLAGWIFRPALLSYTMAGSHKKNFTENHNIVPQLSLSDGRTNGGRAMDT
ncbi:MAG TPA: hypothetical protein ACFCUD_12355 [Cyclobacteriaceae bacterium]